MNVYHSSTYPQTDAYGQTLYHRGQRFQKQSITEVLPWERSYWGYL